MDPEKNRINGQKISLLLLKPIKADDHKVVEETSAVLSGFDSIVLDSDHPKLNKFSSAQDGNYVSVSSNLCRISAEAPELLQRRHKGVVRVLVRVLSSS